MKKSICPSCGAPVIFQSIASIYAVCEFCRSTLLQNGENLENLGLMADLLEDPSPIQIGTSGQFKGRHFAVIGRIQLRYKAGLWNEWHILFDDGQPAWLSDAAGEYTLTHQTPGAELPDFSSLKPNRKIRINDIDYRISSLNVARCIAGQGELPFAVQTGYDVNSADLRNEKTFATLDYSATPPLLFVGEATRFSTFRFNNLKETHAAALATLNTHAFNCPQCAAPLIIHSIAIERLACPSCLSLIGTENDDIKLLEKSRKKLRITPSIPLGSQGKWGNSDWQIIGFMQRSTKPRNPDYAWFEYLLLNKQGRFAWLTEYQGHWNFVYSLSVMPNITLGEKTTFNFNDDIYKQFSVGTAQTLYVIGEFYWQVKVGESAKVADFIAPPKMLSCEISAQEVTWSQGEYIEADQLYSAFSIKTPAATRRVVFANQPNPFSESLAETISVLIIFATIISIIQLIFINSSPEKIIQINNISLLPIDQNKKENTITLAPFVLKDGAKVLRVEHSIAQLDNNWISLNNEIIEKNTGARYEGEQEISFYSGRDFDGAWREGSRSGSLNFQKIPPGEYYLQLETEIGDRQKLSDLLDLITIIQNPRSWSNYLLALLALCVLNAITIWRDFNFESKRWAESDFEGPSRNLGEYND